MRARVTIIRGIAALSGLGLGLQLGCLELQPRSEHCSYQEGDATCATLYPGETMFCSWGIRSCGSLAAKDGCSTTRPSDECYSPCGGDALFMEDSSCLGATGSSSGDEVSTDPSEGSTTLTETADASESSTTGPMLCVANEDCPDPGMPFCEPVSGECIPCGTTSDPDGACAGLDPMAPLCVDDACVQCTAESTAVCDEQRLLCDDASNTCVPCAAHEQCASGACELAVGQCFPEDSVLHVDVDGGADYPSVVAAVNAVVDGAFAVIVVHDRDDGLAYQGAVIEGGKTVALLGAPGEEPSIQGSGTNPGLRVQGVGTAVYLDRLELSNAVVSGLVVDTALAWVDRSRIVGNDGGGIQALNSADLRLRNSFIGGDVNDQQAVTITSASADILYSTLGAGFGDASALACDGLATVEVRNSIMVARTDTDEVACGGTFENNAVELALGGTNVSVGAMQTSWFTQYGTGNFRLSASGTGVFEGIATWESGDPAVDIDGEDRPNTDGASDFAGADRP